MDEITNFIIGLNSQTIALSGGNTPIQIYKELGELEQMQTVEFFQVDERYVEKSNDNSNYKMIKNTLNPKRFHYFNTSLPIEECLTRYADELPEQLDLIILGVGPDGHTASLFPLTPKTERKVAHTQTDHFAIKDRLTLTFPYILKAKTILVLLKDKPEILKELKHPTKTPEQFPAHNLAAHPNLHIRTLQSLTSHPQHL